MPDFYAELHGDAMDFKDGSFMNTITIDRGMGFLEGVKDDKAVLRVFEVHTPDGGAVDRKMLGKKGYAESLMGGETGVSQDLILPEGCDPKLMSEGLQEKFRGRSIGDTSALRANAVETMLTLYGLSDSVANEAAYRNTFDETTKVLNRAFPEGPHSFADKPSKQLAVLQNLKNDLNVGGVQDMSFKSAGNNMVAPGKHHTTVIEKIAHRPS